MNAGGAPRADLPPGTPRPAPTPTSPSLRLNAFGNRLRRFPATYGLIGATILVFLAQLIGNQLAGFDVLAELGAKDNQAIAAGQIWRLVTPLFIHVNILHLFVNMYSLSVIGPSVERLFGSRRFLVTYFLAGVAGVDMSLAFTPAPSVGASGAIFGLLGALGVFLFLHRRTFGRAGAAQLRQIVIVALLNLGLGLLPGIDNFGHLGGLLAGAALAWLIGPRLEPVTIEPTQIRLLDRRQWRDVWPRALAAAAVIALLALAALHSPLGA